MFKKRLDLYNEFLNLVRDATMNKDFYAGDLNKAPHGWFQTEYNNDNIPIKHFGILLTTSTKQVFYSEQNTSKIYERKSKSSKWYPIKPPYDEIIQFGIDNFKGELHANRST